MQEEIQEINDMSVITRDLSIDEIGFICDNFIRKIIDKLNNKWIPSKNQFRYILTSLSKSIDIYKSYLCSASSLNEYNVLQAKNLMMDENNKINIDEMDEVEESLINQILSFNYPLSQEELDYIFTLKNILVLPKYIKNNNLEMSKEHIKQTINYIIEWNIFVPNRCKRLIKYYQLYYNIIPDYEYLNTIPVELYNDALEILTSS